MFCFDISGNFISRKWVKRCIVLLTKKFAKCIFVVLFCARLVNGIKTVHSSLPHDPTSLRKS